MKQGLFYRSWYYFRMGWSTYFAFLFAAVNTLVVTYYLAIEKFPPLLAIFPTFIHYVGIAVSIGMPFLVIIGYIHYKKVPAFSAETDVIQESHPYNFKALPGIQIQTIFPLYLQISQMMIKWSKNEKLSEKEINETIKVQNDLKKLIQGGYVGKPPVTSGLIEIDDVNYNEENNLEKNET
jgi:hypothetical protein